MFKRILLFSSLVCVAGANKPGNGRNQQEVKPDLSGPIAKDGGVELVQIEEKRVSRAYAVKEAAWETKLTVDMKVLVPSKGDVRTAVLLFRFLKLDPVTDNSGKLLSEKATVIGYAPVSGFTHRGVDEEVARSGIVAEKGRRGTELELELKGPTRKATRITKLSGKLEVFEAEAKEIIVPKIAAKSGKVSDPSLRGIKIITSFENGRKVLNVEVEGKVDRLWNWRLRRNGAEWGANEATSEEVSIRSSRAGFGRGFQKDIPKDVDLVLEVLVPVRRHVVSFALKDIKLP